MQILGREIDKQVNLRALHQVKKSLVLQLNHSRDCPQIHAAAGTRNKAANRTDILGAAGSAYGAASSLITLLLWIYGATQILLFGAEFTQVYSNTYGSVLKPKSMR
jgi:hypothetical protein